MGFFDKFSFRKKGKVEFQDDALDTGSSKTVKWSYDYFDQLIRPLVAGSNFIEMFNTIPEVFFPIDYIASRIAGGNFVVRREKDDSVVWRNKGMNRLLNRPNCMNTWGEFVYSHFVYKLTTGNSFVRAAMADAFANSDKYKWCDNYWVLPSDRVNAEPVKGARVPLFDIAEKEDIIKCYRLAYGALGSYDIPVSQIWHDRDGIPEYMNGTGSYTKAHSRLEAQRKPISNLIAVYEARNVIYVKRGGIGFIISKKQDPTGTVALTDKEKQGLKSQVNSNYGIGKGQMPYGISDQPIDFVRTNLSIQELEPFEETLMDAISIAGAYGIPSVLVPRKDQSTFSNQSTAEKSVYASKIIPMAKQFCRDFTEFLGLANAGLYLSVDFNDVDCLQQGKKEEEEVKTNINNRCMTQFNCGVITLNDWRAQIGEEMIENPLFDKLKFDMTYEELDRVNKVINKNTKGDDDGRNQTPAVQNEGK